MIRNQLIFEQKFKKKMKKFLLVLSGEARLRRSTKIIQNKQFRNANLGQLHFMAITQADADNQLCL